MDLPCFDRIQKIKILRTLVTLNLLKRNAILHDRLTLQRFKVSLKFRQ